MRYNLHIEAFTEIEPLLIRRLKEAGFHSIENIVISSPVDIAKSLDIRIDEAISICDKAAIKLEESRIIPNDLSIGCNDWSCHNRSYIKTGSQDLDQLFGGKGVETKAVTQFYGQSATGKTQICHTLSVTVQQLWADYKSIYIDTEGTFRTERIIEIAKARGMEPTRALQNIRCIQPLNSARLESILQHDLCRHLTRDKDIKLLLVDSVINPYRAEYSGRGMLSQRQSRLSKTMHLLQNIARVYDIAVVITNQVQTSVSGYYYCLAESDRPAGGNVITHTSTFMVRLKGNSSYRTAEMKGSPCYPEGCIRFEIYEGGIRDIPQWHPE